MRIFVTGAAGNVGRRLVEILKERNHEVTGVDIRELDITDFQAAISRISAERPELVIHCAAMTHVDRCAERPDEALRINGMGAQNIAIACQQISAAMCYISTNEVFDGESSVPYLEYDAPRPINPYGKSKWFGEQAVRDLVPRHFIVRTSWLFAHGGVNFLQKIVSVAAAGRPLCVVTNEVACPTYAEDFIPALIQLVETGRYGIYHLVNEGRASRYDFARYILDTYGYADYPIQKIVGAQYPRPSTPPVYSVLHNFMAAQIGIKLRPWTDAVNAFVEHERAFAGA
jgi:dTDP-4-dehydrorhamnose reductase